MSEKKAKAPADDFLAQEAKEEAAQAPAYTLDIPEDEIWSYRIEGLQTPRIGKPVHKMRQKQIIVVLVLLVAIGIAIFLSMRAVHTVPFRYAALEDGTAALEKFSNPGDLKTLTIDRTEDGDAKPITALRAFAFNCDEKLTEITIGKTVTSIDATSFYSCWALQTIRVDPENPAYCDLDGVLYTKDLSRVVCYPIDHDQYLREKTGYADLKDDDGKPMTELWGPTETYDEAFFEQYNAAVRTYAVPPSVTVIGAAAFNYANLTAVYLPEGLREIETMAFFKSTSLQSILTYTPAENEGTLADIHSLQGVYPSLPQGLETIGSDAFTGDQALSYLYIPSSVTAIGHHAFWDTCYKEGGEIRGVSEIFAALSQDAFKAQVETGDQWRPQIASGLLPKSVTVHYGAEREG